MPMILSGSRGRSLTRLCFTGLAAGRDAAYEFNRRAVCCYPAPQLSRRQVTPLGFIPFTVGWSSGVTPLR